MISCLLLAIAYGRNLSVPKFFTRTRSTSGEQWWRYAVQQIIRSQNFFNRCKVSNWIKQCVRYCYTTNPCRLDSSTGRAVDLIPEGREFKSRVLIKDKNSPPISVGLIAQQVEQWTGFLKVESSNLVYFDV